MPLALGVALVLAVIWTDSCKRHLWESLGPLHHFHCDCRGYRYYRRHDAAGNIFTFSVGHPEDLSNADRGTLDLTVVEVAGPKATSSFLAFQLGEVVHCTHALAAVSREGGRGVYQELRIPLPSRLTRSVHVFLYGQNRPNSERLLAVAKVPLEPSRMFGLHDITVPFQNFDGEPAGHVRLVMRIGAPGSASFSTIDLIPYMAEASDMSDDCCRPQSDSESGDQARSGGPIVVFSAGGKPSIALPLLEDAKPEEKQDENKDWGEANAAIKKGDSSVSASSNLSDRDSLPDSREEANDNSAGGGQLIATSSSAALARAMPAVVSGTSTPSGPSRLRLGGPDAKLAGAAES